MNHILILETANSQLTTGSIVRLAPNELHINNVSYAEIHFASGSVKLNKYAPHQNQFGMPESTFNTIDASLYKLRRGALAPFFSKRNILALEPMLIQKVESTCQWLEKHKRSNAPIDLRLLFSCMTTDIITEYAFPHCFDLLSTADLSPAWRNTFAKGLRNFQWFGHFPSLWSLLRSIPDHVLLKMSPEMAVTQEWERGNQKLVREIVETYDPNDMPSDHLTIFHELLSSDLPEHEKSYERLWQEGSALIGAGVETTSNTLNVILYHLSQNPTQLDQLKAELLETMPNPSKLAPLSKLETLPYLTAVINEGLRLALGTTSRLIRVAPNSKLQYKDFVFPPGTTVSMSIIGFHHDAKTFPDPLSFVPEPWLEKSSHAALYVFGRGPRMCAGVKYVPKSGGRGCALG